MARLDYASPSQGPSRDLANRIVAERGSLLHLYQMLLHSAPVAEGWLTYLTAIRQHTQLDPALREMTIVRIAHLNRAPYEADQHEPIALRAGVSEQKLRALAASEPDLSLFNDCERAVLGYAEAMTRDIQVPDDVFEQVNQHFDAAMMVELTATIAAYNMVSRFLEALQIHSDDERGSS